MLDTALAAKAFVVATQMVEWRAELASESSHLVRNAMVRRKKGCCCFVVGCCCCCCGLLFCVVVGCFGLLWVVVVVVWVVVVVLMFLFGVSVALPRSALNTATVVGTFVAHPHRCCTYLTKR